MNNKREFDIRRAILSLRLSTTERLVFMAILIRVDWKTYQGEVSAIELASILNLNIRTIQRALKTLKNHQFITRISERTEDGKSTIAMTRINVNRVLKNDIPVSDKSVVKEKESDTDDVRNDKSVVKNVTDVIEEATLMSYYSASNNIYNLYNKKERSRGLVKETKKNDTDDASKKMIIKQEKRLKDWQINAIELQVKRTGNDSFANRKKIAERLYRVKLLKGGFYESL